MSSSQAATLRYKPKMRTQESAVCGAATPVTHAWAAGSRAEPAVQAPHARRRPASRPGSAVVCQRGVAVGRHGGALLAAQLGAVAHVGGRLGPEEALLQRRQPLLGLARRAEPKHLVQQLVGLHVGLERLGQEAAGGGKEGEGG